MNTFKTTALALACAGLAIAAANCTGVIGTSANGPSTTDVSVHWLFAGKPGSAETCAEHKGAKIVVNMTGTVAVSLHRTVTEDCATGVVTFAGLDPADLGMPYIELTLLDEKDARVVRAGELVTAKAGQTLVDIDFYPLPDAGPGTTTSSVTTTSHTTTASTTTASTTTTSSTSTSSSASTTTSSSVASSSASTASSSASSGASSSASGGAGGADGGV